MAAGSPIAGDATAAVDSHRRRPEITQVYTRRNRYKPKPPISLDKPSAADNDVTPSEPPPQPTTQDDVRSNPLREDEEDAETIKIDLRSLSKDQIRDLRKKLADELEQVRALARRIDPDCDVEGGGVGATAAVDEYAQSQLSVSLPNPNFININGNGIIEDSKNENTAPQITEGFKMEDRTPKQRQLTISLAPRIDEGFDYGNRTLRDHQLSLSVASRTDEGLRYENPTPKHHQLSLSVAPRTDESFRYENTAPKRHQLSVSSAPRIDEGFEYEKHMPNHNQLSISVAPRIEEGFEYDKQMPNHRKLSISLPSKISCGIIEGFEKEKRTPKANSFYRNSDFILIGKDKFPPPESTTSMNKRPFFEKRYSQAFKSCAALLSKLMKHKFGWVFNAPVDVKGLGLYDYYSIIKHPMDLGTVKSRLNKNWYKTPGEFAEDVRLTFRNAMTYNPKGQDVHVMAEQLLQIFEERWASIEAEYLYARYPSTPSMKKPPSIDVRLLERSNSVVNYSTPTPTSRPHIVRQPKPKAKDLYKREMTADEREKLKNHLQNLPQEKSDGVVQIIRRRNSGVGLCPNDEEIEIDIDLLDTETLWELDRYVTNYKKSLSKIKRRAELAMLRKAEAERQRAEGRVMGLGVVGEPREQRATALEGKEVNSSLPVGVENRRENAARSGSSSSSSSSGSGSSSSGSDSDSSSSSST